MVAKVKPHNSEALKRSLDTIETLNSKMSKANIEINECFSEIKSAGIDIQPLALSMYDLSLDEKLKSLPLLIKKLKEQKS